MGNVNFDPRVVMRSRKVHRCFACAYNMPHGSIYINYPGIGEDGKFKSLKLCVECSFLIHFKTGEHKEFVREGEFTERRIPNFLKKKRAEFRKNPQKAILDNKLLEILGEKYGPQQSAVSRIIVKTSEFDRRIFHIPESRFKAEQFPAGGELTIKAGVNGKSRIARIIKACSTTGEAFGCTSRQVAILVTV